MQLLFLQLITTLYLAGPAVLAGQGGRSCVCLIPPQHHEYSRLCTPAERTLHTALTDSNTTALLQTLHSSEKAISISKFENRAFQNLYNTPLNASAPHSHSGESHRRSLDTKAAPLFAIPREIRRSTASTGTTHVSTFTASCRDALLLPDRVTLLSLAASQIICSSHGCSHLLSLTHSSKFDEKLSSQGAGHRPATLRFFDCCGLPPTQSESCERCPDESAQAGSELILAAFVPSASFCLPSDQLLTLRVEIELPKLAVSESSAHRPLGDQRLQRAAAKAAPCFTPPCQASTQDADASALHLQHPLASSATLTAPNTQQAYSAVPLVAFSHRVQHSGTHTTTGALTSHTGQNGRRLCSLHDLQQAVQPSLTLPPLTLHDTGLLQAMPTHTPTVPSAAQTYAQRISRLLRRAHNSIVTAVSELSVVMVPPFTDALPDQEPAQPCWSSETPAAHPQSHAFLPMHAAAHHTNTSCSPGARLSAAIYISHSVTSETPPHNVHKVHHACIQLDDCGSLAACRPCYLQPVFVADLSKLAAGQILYIASAPTHALDLQGLLQLVANLWVTSIFVHASWTCMSIACHTVPKRIGQRRRLRMGAHSTSFHHTVNTCRRAWHTSLHWTMLVLLTSIVVMQAFSSTTTVACIIHVPNCHSHNCYGVSKGVDHLHTDARTAQST